MRNRVYKDTGTYRYKILDTHEYFDTIINNDDLIGYFNDIAAL